jgi:polyketide synthase PksN
METVKKYIYSQLAKGNISRDNAKAMLREIFEHTGETANSKDVAIVGIACRFAGANSREEYWRLLRDGVCSINRFPDNRRIDTDVFLPDAAVAAQDPYMYAGYLDEIDLFDNTLFRIPPKEAELMDPVQRIFLETAWKAIEDAGLGGDRLYNSRTGVYVGKDTSSKFDYKSIITNTEMEVSTGTTTSILAGRLSFILNLKGPGIVIDTACSSSLVALHIAYQSILKGEISQAIVGGIALLPFPIGGGVISSPSNRVSSFAKDADGTVWGEGAGVIVLKPLANAVKARDTIYAVIKGSAVNNDGSSNGLTAPSAESQADVIKAAWKNAGIEPETISYIEAHGTGTKLGDPIEAKGITSAFRDFSERRQFCGLGSVKTNVGHTVGAAGISSVIKMALALKNKEIPPNLNFVEPNPYIDLTHSPVYIVDRLIPWDTGEYPRRCGVSSFGFSGTNCHVVMEEAPESEAFANEQQRRHILTLSAKSEKALISLVNDYVSFLDHPSEACLGDICSTASKGRGHYQYRLAILSENIPELKEKIAAVATTGLPIENGSLEGIYFGKYSIVLNKESKKWWEMSEEEKIALSHTANQLIDKANNEDIMEQLCNLYIKGADINWGRIYEDGKYANIPLPVYSFDRRRYWVETYRPSNSQVAESQKINHPLLDLCVSRSTNEAIFTTEFSVKKHWVLSEHTIAGKNAIPGTTYLEMAVAAGKEYFGCDVNGLNNIQFYTPAVCLENQVKQVQLVFKKQGEIMTFSVVSRGTDEEIGSSNQTVHCTGELTAGSRDFIRQHDIQSLSDSLGDEVEIVMAKNPIMGFGSRWRGIRRARLGENEAMVYLELLDSVKLDTQSFTLHPSLLDIATSIAASSVPGHGFYLPFGYGSVKICNSIPSKCYSYIRLLTAELDSEILKFNVEIFDEKGLVAVEIKDFIMKKVHNVRKTMRELSGSGITYFRQEWVAEKSLTSGSVTEAEVLNTSDRKPARILVIWKDSELCEKVTRQIRDLGWEVVEAELCSRQEDYISLLEAAGEISSILFLSSNKTIVDRVYQDDIETGELYSLFLLAGALGKYPRKNRTGLFIATQNSFEVTGNEVAFNPFGAALFALGKVISEENPNIYCKGIDLDNPEEIEAIIREMENPLNHKIIAYRHGERYIPVIGKASPGEKVGQEPEIKEDGFYLVAGGLGGLGLEICKYLSSRGNVRLSLVGRTQLPPRQDWEGVMQTEGDTRIGGKIAEIMELEKEGAVIEVFSADISKIEEIRPVIEEMCSKYGRLNGIINCAGVAGNGFMSKKNPQTFKEVILPKVQGTLVLDYISKNHEMDFMILFSSIEALISSPGQGDYASANAFLNAFAVYRSRLGKKTISIAWPAWQETGMAVDNDAVSNMGISRALSNAEGVNIFEEALSYGQACIIPLKLNYEHIDLSMKDKLPILLSEEVWAEIEESARRYLPKGVQKELDPQKASILITGRDEDDFTSYEIRIAKIWASVLGLEQIDVFESLYDLGGDSIHTIKVLKLLEEMFTGLVDISDIFTYSTVSDLAAHIERKEQDRKEQEDTVDMDEVLRKLANSEISADEADKLLKWGDM